MATSIQVVIDCADPARLTKFWAQALSYQEQEPPPGFASWIDALKARGVPEEDWNSAGAVVDPDGKGPRLFFQRVPEPKIVKNRVHLDVNVGGGLGTPLEERKRRIAAKVEELVGVGATQLRITETQQPFEAYFIVMQDPEGNEFCLQ
jgi:hypothetical protein